MHLILPRITISVYFLLLFQPSISCLFFFFFFNDTATTEIYTLSLHDALPICMVADAQRLAHVEVGNEHADAARLERSEEHTSELQSRLHLVCRLLLEKKKKQEDH